MPTELDNLIELAWYRYNAAYSSGTSLHNALDLAGGYIYDNDYQRCGLSLISAADKALNFREYMTTRYASQVYYMLDALQWISDNWPSVPEPLEVTMSDIIYAMLRADVDDIEYFVGLVDAFRQVMWNKPFNQEFFAAIARGFLE